MGRGQVPDLDLVIVLLAPGPRLGGVAQHALAGHVGVPGDPSRPHQRPLMAGLTVHDEVAAVSHHHVRHLVQKSGPATSMPLPPETSSLTARRPVLSASPGHEREINMLELFQTLRRHTDTRPVTVM